jgi:hypothetical protein
MSVTFLLELAETTGDTRYRDAAIRAMEDFETYWYWGNGAAAEAYNRMLDHFEPELVHRSK